DDRGMDAFGGEFFHQFADVDADIGHDEVGAAGAQHAQRLFDVDGVDDGRAAVDRDLGRGAELALQGPDDQQAHGSLLCLAGAHDHVRSALMISVMVTPRRSLTRTTSPRATRRLLTKMSIASPTLRSSSSTVPG